MDVFVEHIVKKQTRGKDIALRVLLLVGAIVLSMIVLFIVMSVIPEMMTIGFLVSVGIIVGAYYLNGLFNVEYEYIVTNGEIDVDKIIARRKRKRLLTVQVKTFEQYGPYDDNAPADDVAATVVATDNTDIGVYYATFRHHKLGHTLLLFTPDDRVLEAIETHLPRTLRGKR